MQFCLKCHTCFAECRNAMKFLHRANEAMDCNKLPLFFFFVFVFGILCIFLLFLCKYIVLVRVVFPVNFQGGKRQNRSVCYYTLNMENDPAANQHVYMPSFCRFINGYKETIKQVFSECVCRSYLAWWCSFTSLDSQASLPESLEIQLHFPVFGREDDSKDKLESKTDIIG